MPLRCEAHLPEASTSPATGRGALHGRPTKPPDRLTLVVTIEDMTPEKRGRYLARLRALPIEKRLQLALDTIQRGKSLRSAMLRSENPFASEREIQRRIATWLSGREIADRAYRRHS